MKHISAFILLIVLFSFNSNGQSSESAPSDSITWYEYYPGKYDVRYSNAKQWVLNSMGIGMEVFLGDCGGTYNYKYEEFEKKNFAAIEFLKSKFGLTWKEELNKLVKIEKSRGSK